jgi:hypothetical protein
MMDEQGQPWDRQPGENSVWYGRFREYLLHRQLLPIYNAERGRAGKSPLSSTPAAWKQAKERFSWEERAIAWDAHHQNAQEAEWLAKWDKYREKVWQQAQALSEKADLMLRHPHVTQTVERVHTATHAGEQVPVAIVIKPVSWRMRDVPVMYKLAAELARTAVGDAELAINYLSSLGYTITEPGAEENDDYHDNDDY